MGFFDKRGVGGRSSYLPDPYSKLSAPALPQDMLLTTLHGKMRGESSLYWREHYWYGQKRMQGWKKNAIQIVLLPGNSEKVLLPCYEPLDPSYLIISSTILLSEMQGPLESVNVFQNKDF